MKLSWSVISIMSRFSAVGIGLVQSIIVVKLLTVGEYGLVGLVTSIAAVVGVYQNLGISSGATREIAATKHKQGAFKVFIGALLVRYSISLPLIFALFILAPHIGNNVYHRSEIITPLRIFSVILFVQVLQSVLNSVIQGLQKFKFLFTFQVLIALVSLVIYVSMLMEYGFMGFFYAFLAFNIISTAVLSVYVYRTLKRYAVLPTSSELKSIIKAIFSIGIFVYVIKIVLMQWQKLGPILLGRSLDNEMLGILSFALLVSSKISTISDAITDVTLPSMTNVYNSSREKFQKTFIEGNSKAYLLILFASLVLFILKREIFLLVDILFIKVGKAPITTRYEQSFVIMDPLILAFWAYSHLNLLKSGLAVPMKKMWSALISFIVMFGATIAVYFALGLDPILSFAIAMGFGAAFAYLVFIVLAKRTIGFYPISKNDVVITLLTLPFIGVYYLGYSHVLIVVIYTALTYVFYKRNFA